MKILQVVPYFYPAWAYGGPAKLVYDTSMFFAKHGHDVTVYTSDAFDRTARMPKEKRLRNVEHLTVHYFRNLNNAFAYVYNIFVTPGLFGEALMHVKDFDIIHLHDFYTPQNVWIGWFARAFHVPYVLSVHGCLEEQRVKQQEFFKRVFLTLFGKGLLRHASRVVATSPNEVAAYQTFGIPTGKIVRLGHGVDAKEFIAAETKAQCRRHFGLKPEDVVVTYLGRIHKIKGLDLLVGALSLMKEKRMTCVLAGSDDGYLSQLKKLIASHDLSQQITLLGTCFGKEKAMLFKATDIFVYPSYSEGFSLGILEATAAGLPLVITTGCHFDAVKTYGAGIIVEPSSASLVAGIMTFVRDPKLRKHAAQQAKKLIAEKYSMEHIGSQILDVYTKER